MPTTLHENRPSAGIGMVEVQKLEVCAISISRATLCGDRRGRGTKSRFLKFPRDPLRGSAWSRCKNSRFLRFLRCSRNPLRESAWSRCKISRFFASFAVRTGPRELSRGSRASRDRVRFLPGPRKGVAKCNLHKATCAEQLAQSKLHRATRPVCAERLA